MAIFLLLFTFAILLTAALRLVWRRIAFFKITTLIFTLLVSITWAADRFYKPYPRYSLWLGWNCMLSGLTDCHGYSSPLRNTKLQLHQLSEELKLYRADCGIYPTTELGLEALLEKPVDGIDCKDWGPPYARELELTDGWGYPIQYVSDGKTFSLSSLGRDGQVGGIGGEMDMTIKSSESSETAAREVIED